MGSASHSERRRVTAVVSVRYDDGQVREFALADLRIAHFDNADPPETRFRRADQRVRTRGINHQVRVVTGFRAHHSAFRTCAEKVAQLLGINVAMPTMETRGGRRIAAALRKPLLERGAMPEELFDAVEARWGTTTFRVPREPGRSHP